MKRFAPYCIMIHLAALPVLADSPSLSFTSKTVSVTLKPDETSARIVFPFENLTQQTIEIERQSSSCSCIAAEFKDGKTTYAPGERGEVAATFQVGNLHGSVKKNVVIWQKGDKANEPAIILTAEIEIPELVSISPKSLNWKVDEESEPKTYRITVHEEETIHVTDVVTTNNHFVSELRTITEGKEYEITVTPKDTHEPGFGIMKITTDSQTPRYRRIQGFAAVMR